MAIPEKTPKTGRKQPQRPVADKEQYERFREFAREVGADGGTEAFDRAFQRIVPRRETK